MASALGGSVDQVNVLPSGASVLSPPLDTAFRPNEAIEVEAQAEPTNPTADTNSNTDPATTDIDGNQVITSERLTELGFSGEQSEMDAFLDDLVHKPVPVGMVLQCKILRKRSGKKHEPQYFLHIEDRHGLPGLFLLSARKRKKSRNSCYLIGRSKEQLVVDSSQVLGRVRSNFLGTEFVVYGPGSSPDKRPSPASLSAPTAPPFPASITATATATVTPDRAATLSRSAANSSAGQKRTGGASSCDYREEHCAILYDPNILGFKGPRKMTLLLPALASDGSRQPFRPTYSEQVLVASHRARIDPSILALYNKSPQWNEESQSYVLNFNGRVTMASVKNFQIVNDCDLDYIILQFGRVEHDIFTLDFQYPITPFQAFGIALSSFDAKLACE
ncbi:hypothetical protein H4R35_001234 [Dimargaris xerosporica]|nr:hypothetical protein H4R35_001234 [Dimargaris xerosporica]